MWPSDELKDIQKWYHAQCDGEWEHDWGVRIDTMDNPGWLVKIDLEDTILEGKEFNEVSDTASELDWIVCKVTDNVFEGYGGPKKLRDILKIFLKWAKSEPDWLAVPPPAPPPSRAELDAEFYESLGDEIGPEVCSSEGCERKRIEMSTKCRLHHFEMVRRYPYEPDKDK